MLASIGILDIAHIIEGEGLRGRLRVCFEGVPSLRAGILDLVQPSVMRNREDVLILRNLAPMQGPLLSGCSSSRASDNHNRRRLIPGGSLGYFVHESRSFQGSTNRETELPKEM